MHEQIAIDFVLASVKGEVWQGKHPEISKQKELGILLELLREKMSPISLATALQTGEWYLDGLIQKKRKTLLAKILVGEFTLPKETKEDDAIKGDYSGNNDADHGTMGGKRIIKSTRNLGG